MVKIIFLLALLVSVLACIVFSLSSYKRFLKVYHRFDKEFVYCNLTGYQFACFAIDKLGLKTRVAVIEKELGECYVPSKDIVCISRHTAEVSSVSSVCVTAHELGHAVQNQKQSGIFVLQTCLQFLSKVCLFLFPFLLIAGIVLLFVPDKFDIGIVFLIVSLTSLFVVFLFKLLTIPMERQASKIAYSFLKDNNVLSKDELSHAKKVLNAALSTYVAGLFLPIIRFFRGIGKIFKI